MCACFTAFHLFLFHYAYVSVFLMKICNDTRMVPSVCTVCMILGIALKLIENNFYVNNSRGSLVLVLGSTIEI